MNKMNEMNDEIDISNEEMLMLAKQAAGYTWVDFSQRDGRFYWRVNPDETRIWDPLTDDGDAFKLSTKLRLNVEHGRATDDYVSVSRHGIEGVRDPVRVTMQFDDESERLYHTRLAIVRAAAEIGETLN